MQVIFDLFLGMFAFLAGLYIDGLKQTYRSIVEWISEEPEEPYTIKAEDYWDGRRDS